MKKIFYGSVVLCLFAISITLVEISCQKTMSQSSNPGTANGNGNFILYAKTSWAKIPVVTQTDSGTYTSYISYYQSEYYRSDLSGGNEIKIPIVVSDNLYVGTGAKLTIDGNTIVFNVYTKPTASDQTPGECYVYACSLDGTNLKKVKDQCGFDDVH